MTDFIVKVAVSYLLGSLLGSLVLARLRGGVDIRALGSGSAGATHALRTQGKLFALGVAVIDVGKGWLATRWIPRLELPLLPPAALAHNWLPVACGAAAMLGHVYPLWFGFRGGKAVATCLGAVLGIAPRVALTLVFAWLGVLVLTGFVGLASIVATAVLPLAVVWADLGWYTPLLVFGFFAAALITFTHRANILRMWAGREPRAQRFWLFGRRAA